jgi:hypothetical protein
MTFYNENWYYLYLEDGQGGIVVVPPESEVDLSSYFLKYEDNFIRDTTPGITPTDAIPIGSEVVVHANNELDGKEGIVMEKDSVSYKVDFGTEGKVWFPYTEVELQN